MTLRHRLVIVCTAWVVVVVGLLILYAALLLWLVPGGQMPLDPQRLVLGLIAVAVALSLLTAGVTAFASRRLLDPIARTIKERELDVRQAVRDVEREHKELAAVARYADFCTAFHSSTDLYRNLTAQLARTVGASVCFIMLYERAANKMVAQSPAYGLADQVVDNTRYEVTSEVKSGWNFATQGSLLSNDPQGDRRVLKEIVRGLGLFNCIVVPFFFQRRVTGLIVAANKPKWFTHDDVRLLTAFSSYTSLAVANQQLQNEVRRTIRDSLTGLYTAHYFRTRLEQAISTREPGGAGFSAIALAIDDFRGHLDLHGRQVADRIIKEVAGLLAANAEDNGLIARYGAHEFVIFLAEADRDDAVTTAERIRVALEEYPFASERGVPLAVTVSMGIASSLAPISSDALLRAAQGALRRAKQEGKPLVVTAGAEW